MMPREHGVYIPETKPVQDNPLIKNYLTNHPDLSEREQEFLLSYYKNLKTEMTTRSASVFRKEAKKIQNKIGEKGDFKKAWGTKTSDPEKGPNATKLFMDEVADIQETAAKQTIKLFEMRRTAEIDHLTGLYRGEAFDKYAEEMLLINQTLLRESNKDKPEGEKLVSVYVAFDVDNFKTVNDTIGHVKADREILTPMGGKVREVIRSVDLASRIGGDEFVVLFTQIRKDAVNSTVERLLSSVGGLTYTDKDGNEVPVTVSAGVKIIEDDEQISLKKARHLADEAANLAKIEKNTFFIYTPDLAEKIEKMITEDIGKPDEENRGLQFYIRQEYQKNKRTIERIAKVNEKSLQAFESSVELQARINLETTIIELKSKEKSA